MYIDDENGNATGNKIIFSIASFIFMMRNKVLCHFLHLKATL